MPVDVLLSYRSYRWRDADEWLAEIGAGPKVLIVPPLFEELNRCRALLAGVMRGLAEAGLHAVLPDLPGTGESRRELTDVAWEDWTGTLGLLTHDLRQGGQVVHLAGFRGGSLIAQPGDATRLWSFAPVTGAALGRDLIRARQAASADKPRADAIEAEARVRPTEFAGYTIPPAVFAPLLDAELAAARSARTVRLASDPAAADLKLEGKPLWRQAEPGNDPALAAALAADLVSWVRTCAG